MDIKTIASGSSGNCYKVDSLLIDAGITIKKIKQGLNYKLSSMSGCLISHAHHSDHSRAANDLMKAGIEVYASRETAEASGLSGHRLNIIEHGKQFSIGPWRIKPMEMKHDIHNLGFLLAKGDEKLFFCVDTNYVPYKFTGLTHIMMGVNYDINILGENVSNGSIHPSLASRIAKNHMSIDTALEFLRLNDMSIVEEVHLLHLSDSNSDEGAFKRKVQRVTGVPVFVA